jgi:hypothetical protein
MKIEKYQSKKKGAMAIVFALALWLGMMPATAGNSYILVGDEMVGDTKDSQSGTNWSWDAMTQTLTLTGNIVGDNGISFRNMQAGEVTIAVEAECQVAVKQIVYDGSGTYSVDVAGELTLEQSVTGNVTVSGGRLMATSIGGDLRVESGLAFLSEDVEGNVTVSGGEAKVRGSIGGSLTITGGEAKVYMAYDVNLSGFGILRATYIEGSLTVEEEADVEISGSVAGDVLLSGGTVVVGNEVRGLLTVLGGTITVDVAGNAEVSGKGRLQATNIEGTLTVSDDAKVNISGDVTGPLSVEGGTVQVDGEVYARLQVMKGEVKVGKAGLAEVYGGYLRAANIGYLTVLTGVVEAGGLSFAEVSGNGFLQATYIDGDLTVSEHAEVIISGDVTGNLTLSGGTVTVDGEVLGEIHHTGGSLNDAPPPLTFTAEQTGGAAGPDNTSNSTGIVLVFDRDITRLLVEHITLTDGTGRATKGDLFETSANTYTLALAGVSGAGTVYVSVDYPGYNLSASNPQPVEVYLAHYTVTVVSAGAGASAASRHSLGERVPVDAGAAPDGQRFVRWTATPAVVFDPMTLVATSFVMPAADVTATAHFAPCYAVHLPSTEGGTVTAEPLPPVAGETVTLRLISENGYATTTADVRLTTAPYTRIELSGTGDTRTFVMPDGAVTVTAAFHKTPDRLAVEAAVARLENVDFVVAQEMLNTENAVFMWLLDTLNCLLVDLDISIPTRNVFLYGFSKAVAGTPALPLGRDGGFMAHLSFSRNGNYAEQYVSGSIRATVYRPTGIDVPPTDGLTAYGSKGVLQVTGLVVGEVLSVYDLSGKLVYRRVASREAVRVPLTVRGLYLVRACVRSVKRMY